VAHRFNAIELNRYHHFQTSQIHELAHDLVKFLGGWFQNYWPRKRRKARHKGHLPGLCDWPSRRSIRCPGSGRDRLPEDGQPCRGGSCGNTAATAGPIENCQIGVFLGYAGPKGHPLIDRRARGGVDKCRENNRIASTRAMRYIEMDGRPAIESRMPLAMEFAETVQLG
jgi:hypothetical protein